MNLSIPFECDHLTISNWEFSSEGICFRYRCCLKQEVPFSWRLNKRRKNHGLRLRCGHIVLFHRRFHAFRHGLQDVPVLVKDWRSRWTGPGELKVVIRNHWHWFVLYDILDAEVCQKKNSRRCNPPNQSEWWLLHFTAMEKMQTASSDLSSTAHPQSWA